MIVLWQTIQFHTIQLDPDLQFLSDVADIFYLYISSFSPITLAVAQKSLCFFDE